MPKYELEKRELLGHIKTTSSTVMLVDFSFLDIWCHDDIPNFPEWVFSDPEATERASNAVDIKITGPDALEAGNLFDRNWHPEYLYDIPQDGIEEIIRLFDSLVKERNLN